MKKLLHLAVIIFTAFSIRAQDLTLTSFTLSSTNLASGSYFYPTLVAKNLGTAVAGITQVGFYLSTDSILTISDTYLAYASTNSLGAGVSTTLSPTVSLPNTLTNGQYYLFAYIDNLGAVSETNEANNSKRLAISVSIPTIDLVITSASLSATTVSPGDAINTSCSLFNNGNSSSSYSNVGYYFSSDSIYDASDTYLAYSYGYSLASGSSSSLSGYISIPSVSATGTFYILFKADYDGSVSESNEENNVKPIAITVTKPTYTVVPANGNMTISTCSTTIYDSGGPNASYSNYSNGSLTIYPETTGNYVTLNFTSLSLEGCCDYVMVYDGTSTSAPLIGSYGNNLPSTLYATNSSGALTVMLYSDGSSTYSGFAATVACVTSVPKPDLVVSILSLASTTVNPGYTISPTVYVENKGNNVGNSTSFGFYISSDSTLNIGDTFLGSYSIGALGSNSGYYLYPYLTIPMGTLSGSYYLLAVADEAGYVTESNETNNIKPLAITVAPPSIDLRISSINLTNSSVVAGNYVYPSVYEQNLGSTSVGYHLVYYFLSTDTTYGIGDTYLGGSTTSSLEGNASVYLSPSFMIPFNTLAGSYYIIAVADADNSVLETVETNNSKYLKVNVLQPSIDLSISSFTSSSVSVSPGYYFSTTATLTNSGKDASPYGDVGFYLSTDSVYGSDDTFLTYTSQGSIWGGASYSVYPSVYIPTGLAYGPYYLIAVADYNGMATELNENNNTKSLRITLNAPTVDLSLTSFSSTTTSLEPGAYLYSSLTELNSGNVTADYHLIGYYLSSDSVYGIGDTFLTYSYAYGLLPGNSNAFTPTIAIPSNVLYGSYYIIAVTDYSSGITETNENNNTKALKINITQPNVDLRIKTLSLSTTSITVGGYFSPYVTEINSGLTQAGSHNVYFYLSTDSVYSFGDTYLSYSTLYSLSGGATYDFAPYLYIPSGITNGQYYLIAITDHDGTVSEINENNNSRAIKISVESPSRDLVISTLSSSNTRIARGGTIVVSYTENNLGNISADYHYNGFYLSTDSIYDAGDTYMSYHYVSSLMGGGQYSSTLSFTVPDSWTPGRYYLIVVADYSNYIQESKETNNTRTVPITILQPNVDLQINGLTHYNVNVAPGDFCRVQATEINVGTTFAPSTLLGFFLSSDSVYGAEDTFLANYAIPTLDGGASYSLSASLYVPSTTAFGQYYIIAKADYLSTATESNENNNTRATRIVVGTPFIDLVVASNPAYNSSAKPGEYIYMNGNMTNIGNTYASSSSLGYYLSTDSTYDSGDAFLASFVVEGIEPGYSYGGYVSLLIPQTLTPGTYYIVSYADYLGQVSESIENNNTKAFKITVTNENFVDLMISALSLGSKTVHQGEYLTVTSTVANIGTSSTSVYDYSGYYLSVDSVYSSNDELLASSKTSYYLTGGNARTEILGVFIPYATFPGDYYLVARADYTLVIGESNELNNTKAIRFHVNSIVTDMETNDRDVADLKMYPNPSKGIITLGHTEDVDQVEVYDLGQQMVFASDLNQGLATQLNISHLADGLYILRTKKNGTWKHTKTLILTK